MLNGWASTFSRPVSIALRGIEKDKDSENLRQIERERQWEKERGKERRSETKRDRDRQTETERDRVQGPGK